MVSHVFSQNDPFEYLKDYRPTPGFQLHVVFLFFKENLMAFQVFSWYLQKKDTCIYLCNRYWKGSGKGNFPTLFYGDNWTTTNRGNEVYLTSSFWLLNLQPLFHQSTVGFNNTATFSLLLTGLRPTTNFTYRNVIFQLLSSTIFQSLLCRIIFINKSKSLGIFYCLRPFFLIWFNSHLGK